MHTSQSPVRASGSRPTSSYQSNTEVASDNSDVPADDAAPAGPNSKRKPTRRNSIDISSEPQTVVTERKVWDSMDPTPTRKSGSKSRLEMDKPGAPSKSPGLKRAGSLTPKEIDERAKAEGKDVTGGYKWKPGKKTQMKVLAMDKSKYEVDGVVDTEDEQVVLAEEEGVDTIVELNCGGIRCPVAPLRKSCTRASLHACFSIVMRGRIVEREAFLVPGRS